MSGIKNTLGALGTGALLIAGSPEAEAQVSKTKLEVDSIKTEVFNNLSTENNLENTITREENEQLNAETPWGGFFMKELGISLDENTAETIQKYFGKLSENIQQELKSFITTNKSLFPDQENLMYGLGTLLHSVAREQFIDKKGVNITNKIIENENYIHDEANLDKIDESIKGRRKELHHNPEVALAIFENIYNNTKDPAQKEKIGKDLNELKENYQRLLQKREENLIADKELQKNKDELQLIEEKLVSSKKEAFEKSLAFYNEFKNDPKPWMEEVLFKVVENFKKLDSEEITPEIKKMIEEVEKIKIEKK